MPGMDGLQFTEKLLQKNPKCRVVIVTGFREFEYARKAIKLGVDEFLLKPVNIKEISEVMTKIKTEIAKVNEEESKVAKLKESAEKNYDILRESFLLRLVENRIGEEEATKKLETYNCNDLVDGCVCINVKIKDAQENQNYKKVYEFIQKQNNENSLSFIHFMHNIVMFFTKTDVSKCIDYANDLHNKLNNMGITATIGVSEKNSEFNGIPAAYGQANKAIGVSVLLGRNKVVTFSEYQEIMKKNSSKKEIDWDEFSDAIINCRREEVLKYVSDYTEIIKAEKIPDEEYLKLKEEFEKNNIKIISCMENKYQIGDEKDCCISIKYAFERTGKLFKEWKARDCHCVSMVDVGAYNSCLHGCKYCYANFDSKQIVSNYKMHDVNSSLLIGQLNLDDQIKIRRK